MLAKLAIPVGWPVRVLAVITLIAAVFAFGFIKGKQDGAADMERLKGAVNVVGIKQQTKIDSVAANADKITEAIEDNHEKSRNRLIAIYGPGRVLRPASGGSGKTETVPEAPGKPDGGSANLGLGSGVRTTEKAESVECRALKSDAAMTTLQLLGLRAWVEEQKVNWDDGLLEKD